MVTVTDLAKLYHVETKRINEATKNNLDKFDPKDIDKKCFAINEIHDIEYLDIILNQIFKCEKNKNDI